MSADALLQIRADTRPDSALWYPVTALRRPQAVVMLKGQGYTGKGYRGAGRHPVYYLLKGGAPVRIRPPFAPVLFRPLGDWPDPLPPAVKDSLTTHHSPLTTHAPDPPPLPYAKPGHITRDEAEERLIRALRTCRTYRECDVDLAGSRVLWPSILREWSDFTGHVDENGRFIARDRMPGGTAVDQPAPPPQFKPTPRDHSDVLTAMRWFTALAPVTARYRHETWRLSGDQLLVWRCALDPPWSWRQIGEEAGRSHEWARERYQRIIDTIEGIANAKI